MLCDVIAIGWTGFQSSDRKSMPQGMWAGLERSRPMLQAEFFDQKTERSIHVSQTQRLSA
jgi:hypothetical protein